LSAACCAGMSDETLREAAEAALTTLTPTRDATVEKYTVQLRSNLHRSADRAIRGGIAAGKPRRPRPDNEVMAAWVIRGATRLGACPVDDPTWHYDPGVTGPDAIQTATVRCLIPKDDAERRMFTGMRIPSSTHTLRYFHPDDRPPVTVVR
jgi:hypothetical protein